MEGTSGSRFREGGVGTAVTAGGGGDGGQDGGGVGDDAEVGGGGDRPCLDERLQDVGGNVRDVALPPVDRSDDLGKQVDEDDLLARLGERVGVRHADVAGADDGDVIGAHSGVEAYR